MQLLDTVCLSVITSQIALCSICYQLLITDMYSTVYPAPSSEFHYVGVVFYGNPSIPHAMQVGINIFVFQIIFCFSLHSVSMPPCH